MWWDCTQCELTTCNPKTVETHEHKMKESPDNEKNTFPPFVSKPKSEQPLGRDRAWYI